MVSCEPKNSLSKDIAIFVAENWPISSNNEFHWFLSNKFLTTV